MNNTKKQTTTTKAKPTTKDYISQIKKDVAGDKDNKAQDINDDWEKQDSEEEEEETKTVTKVVVEQGKVGATKPKTLLDVLGATEQPKLKPKQHSAQTKKDEKKPESKKDYSDKPKFVNSAEGIKTFETETTGKQQKYPTDNKFRDIKKFTNAEGAKTFETETSGRPQRQTQDDKFRDMKKFTNVENLITKTTDENSKVKKTKDYIESKTENKQPEPELEKPKFLSHTANVTEPKLVDIDKSQDLFYKNLVGKENAFENVYAEKKEGENRGERDQRAQKPYKKPRKSVDKKQDVEVDSDGFEVISHEKKRKVYNNEDRPYYKKQYKPKFDNKEGGRFDKEGRKFKKTQDKKEENTETIGENAVVETEAKADTKAEPEIKVQKDLKDKKVFALTTKNTEVRSLKDLLK